MKVAVIVDTWFPFIGGGQRSAWEISKRLAKKGVVIDLITRNNGENKLQSVKNLRIIKLGKFANPEHNFSRIIFLYKAFRYTVSNKYDLVHGHAFLSGFLLIFLKIFAKKSVIYTVHGTSLKSNLKSPFSKFIEWLLLAKTPYDYEITVSRDFLKYPNINKKVVYIPNGVDVREFDQINISKFNNPTLIFAGRLHKQKNIPALLDAFSLIIKKIPLARLLIIGSGPEEETIKSKIKELDLKTNVGVLGEKNKEELIKYYKKSHVFVLTSVYEGFPLSMLEAWAAKIPVVVPRTGECAFLVKEGANGFLISDSSNINEIAKVLEKALKFTRLKGLGENGYNLVCKNYTWDKAAEKTLEIYNKLNLDIKNTCK